MRKIAIKKMYLKNFKKFEELTVNFSDLTIIKGKNGSGKSTIFDAYFFLLTDNYNSSCNSFNPKPINKFNIEVTVEGLFDLIENDSRTEILLKKVMYDEYDEDKNEIKGYRYEYFVNNQKIKKTEYYDFIKKIFSDLFMFISSVKYFEKITNEEKRKIVLGKLEENKKSEIYEKCSMENKDYLIKFNYNFAEILKDIETKIRVNKDKIDQNTIKIKELNGLFYSAINVDIEIVDKKIAEIESEILKLKNGDLQNQIFTLKKYVNDYILNIKTTYQNELNQYKIKKQNLENHIYSLQSSINNFKNKLNELRKILEEKQNEEYNEGNNYCPTCNQEFPKEYIEKKIIEFNEKKHRFLKNTISEIISTEKELKEKEKELEENKNVLNKLKEPKYEDFYYETIEYKEAVEKIKQYELLMNEQNFTEKVKELEQKKDELYKEKIKYQENEKIKKRLSELNNEILEYQKNIQNLLFLESEMKEITKNYYEEIENKINVNLTDNLKIHLFKKYFNGKIEPIFDISYNDVKYQDLSYSEKARAILQIMNFVSKNNNVLLPVFVDNSESFNYIPKIENQLILLFVNKEELQILNL